MVTHTQLQQYQRRHGMVCLTGLLGCRWHRYKQSTRDSRKRDLAWFIFLILVFSYTAIWFYMWMVGQNDSDKMNWFIYSKTGSWFQYHLLVVILTGLTFSYLLILVILALCHAGHGHQIYIHWVHRLLLVVMLVFCVIATIGVSMFWREGWALARISLHITGPFLQIGFVIFATGLSWLIAAQLVTMPSTGWRIFWSVVFVASMIFLYCSPLLIKSPCVVERDGLPPKPKIVAHRGASAIAPENTEIAFKYAHDYKSYALESDVLISHDGVPFIMHDTTLRRTTNVDKVFPDLVDQPAYMFNISQLKQLNTGDWFIQNDPLRAKGSLTPETEAVYRNQTVLTLSELLHIVRTWKTNLMFDVRAELPDDHPYKDEAYNMTLQTIVDAGIPHEQIWWLTGSNSSRIWANMTLVAPVPIIAPVLVDRGIFSINTGYNTVSDDLVRYYTANNISTNLYVVNSPWLYSLFWCMGATSVTTDFCHVFHDMGAPVWQLSPQIYLILWVVIDVVSAGAIIVIFIIQRSRHTHSSFNPEAISLQAARHRMAQHHNHPKKAMKEKLILPAESLTDLDQGINGMSSIDPATYNSPGWNSSNGDGTISARSSTSLAPSSTQSVNSSAPYSPNTQTGQISSTEANGGAPYSPTSPNVDIDEVKLDMGNKY